MIFYVENLMEPTKIALEQINKLSSISKSSLKWSLVYILVINYKKLKVKIYHLQRHQNIWNIYI